MLVVPAVLYAVYVFGRGALIGKYPYKVVDASLVGYPSALTYAAVVIIGIAAICTIIIIADKILARSNA